MILCVSANPAMDRRLRLPTLTLGEVNRADSSQPMAGGKAAHVAMASRALGARAGWIGFLGGAIGDQIGNELRKLEIEVFPVKTQAATRVNLELVEDSGRITEVLEPGGSPTAGECEELIENMATLLRGPWKGAWVAISGSLPEGVKGKFYFDLVTRAKQWGSKVFLDTSGEGLQAGLRAGPDLVKPNRTEAETLLGRPLSNPGDAAVAAAELVHGGVGSAAITLGAEGLVWSETARGPTWSAKPPLLRAISSVGCGDATFAGFAYAALQGWSGEQAVRFATACGAANCLAEQTAQISMASVTKLIPLIEISKIAPLVPIT
jgi:1-phosphofructokinase family hexose kinase